MSRHGRIWRITAKGRPLVPRPKLVEAKTTELLEALKEPEDWTRHHARLTLKERGAKSVLPALETWWTQARCYQAGDGAIVTGSVMDVSGAGCAGAEAAASVVAGAMTIASAPPRRVVLGQWHTRLAKPLELLTNRVGDEHPQVRLEAVRALDASPACGLPELRWSRLISRWISFSTMHCG